MAAANARIGVAKAASFPVLTLTGSAGWQSAKLEDLITADSLVWSIGPSLSIPVFAGGRNTANLKATKADYAEAVAEYRRRILVAFQEVEDALAATRLLAQQQFAHTGVVDASRQAAALSLDRFTQGLVSFLDVVDAERMRLEAERRAAQIRGQRMAAAILLIKALGGGWDAELADDVPPHEGAQGETVPAKERHPSRGQVANEPLDGQRGRERGGEQPAGDRGDPMLGEQGVAAFDEIE
jgi:multidrug efflux system outer membrane protein